MQKNSWHHNQIKSVKYNENSISLKIQVDNLWFDTQFYPKPFNKHYFVYFIEGNVFGAVHVL